jgi:hypothetical protein
MEKKAADVIKGLPHLGVGFSCRISHGSGTDVGVHDVMVSNHQKMAI